MWLQEWFYTIVCVPKQKIYYVCVLLVGYSKDDVEYRWTKGRGVNIASDMKLSQFDLIKTPTGNATIEVNKGKNPSFFWQF